MSEESDRILMLERRQIEHEKRIDEFMLRTDSRLEVLLTQSAQWTGVRQTLTVIVTIIGFLGAVVGFFVHLFLPNGIQLKP